MIAAANDPVPMEAPARLRTARLCGLAGLALGLAVLAGWALDIATLKTVLPGLVAMQPSAALGLAAGGLALAAASVHGRTATGIRLLASLVLLAIAGQALLAYAGFGLGSDIWLSRMRSSTSLNTRIRAGLPPAPPSPWCVWPQPCCSPMIGAAGRAACSRSSPLSACSSSPCRWSPISSGCIR